MRRSPYTIAATASLVFACIAVAIGGAIILIESRQLKTAPAVAGSTLMVSAEFTDSSRSLDIKFSEVCIDGVAYLVNAAGGITVKFEKSATGVTPATCEVRK